MPVSDIKKDKLMKIAIIRLSSIGDIIHCCHVPYFIKKKYPQATIDWYVYDRFFQIIEHNPFVDNIISLPNKALSLVKKALALKKTTDPYDYIFDFHGLIQSAILSYLLPGKSIGYDKCHDALAPYLYNYTYSIADKISIYEKHLTLINRHLQTKLDGHIEKLHTHSKHLFYPKSSLQKSQQLLKKNNHNVIIVHSSSKKCKNVPPEKYSEVITTMQQRSSIHFIIPWGNEYEREEAFNIKNLSNNCYITILEKKEDFNFTKALIDQVDLVIGGDTGLIHAAWALQKPSVAIFNAYCIGKSETFYHTNERNLAHTSKNFSKLDTQSIIKMACSLLSLYSTLAKKTNNEYSLV